MRQAGAWGDKFKSPRVQVPKSYSGSPPAQPDRIRELLGLGLYPGKFGTCQQLPLFQRFGQQASFHATTFVTESPTGTSVTVAGIVANTRVTESHQAASYSRCQRQLAIVLNHPIAFPV